MADDVRRKQGGLLKPGLVLLGLLGLLTVASGICHLCSSVLVPWLPVTCHGRCPSSCIYTPLMGVAGVTRSCQDIL